jgi:uncharacterized protein (DUF1015 family)
MLLEPIRALRPTPELAAGVAELPYDVMDRAEARQMSAGRPHSFLHVTRPDIDQADDADPHAGYRLAAAALGRLITSCVLERDAEPAYHAYRMSHRGQQQTGIVGGASVAAYTTGRIRRHETTRPDKQADRASHMEAVGAQTGPVLLMHRSSPRIEAATRAATLGTPFLDVTGPGGVRHQVWRIGDPGAVTEIEAGFEELSLLYIADGHHRSAAAAVVHERLESPASGRFLAVAFPADQMVILAYNRLVRLPAELTPEALVSALAQRCAVSPAQGPVQPEKPGEVGLYLAGRWWLLRFADVLLADADASERLDVAILQKQVLEPLLGIADPRTDPRIGFAGGVRTPGWLVGEVDAGRWEAGFTLYPTSTGQLMDVADAGGIMPPKSTWFEPKLLDGLITHVLD